MLGWSSGGSIISSSTCICPVQWEWSHGQATAFTWGSHKDLAANPGGELCLWVSASRDPARCVLPCSCLPALPALPLLCESSFLTPALQGISSPDSVYGWDPRSSSLRKDIPLGKIQGHPMYVSDALCTDFISFGCIPKCRVASKG